MSHKENDGFIVTDKVLIDNIEICDLIKFEEGKVFLYHVKKGLGRDLRVLANQVINASRLVFNAVNEEDASILKLYYKRISDKYFSGNDLSYKNGSNQNNLSESRFITILKESEIVFVFSYSSIKTNLITEEFIETNSRVAKLSFIYCVRDMLRGNNQFLIERIKES